MRILISHFHLQTGGVTRVIEHASTALAAGRHRVLVVAGEPPRQPLPKGVGFALVPALAYEERRPAVGPAELAAELVRTARAELGDMPDLWHIHNHCLGKNLALPEALCTLARQGQRLLLQPHDFAEDGRPGLYARLLGELGGGIRRDSPPCSTPRPHTCIMRSSMAVIAVSCPPRACPRTGCTCCRMR